MGTITKEATVLNNQNIPNIQTGRITLTTDWRSSAAAQLLTGISDFFKVTISHTNILLTSNVGFIK